MPILHTVKKHPMLADSEQILELHNKPLNVPEYPNHTQSVERTVKVVSDTSKSVYGHYACDGFIQAKILPRNIMRCYDSKQQFLFVTDDN